ncbi:nuclear transport factor 2 family protein [Sphingomonas yunnanensis]|uniref:nuclear transport factor 2 family protein n=1 Tax=Sphingomonas yunnanensis TaxID=310400 RepID=UPI001CA7816A|nr:nuclear transport factor 2 family protein [Sphingomonas yunnanensis]MBY9064361.1 nuclear transport factor 2 family protein [Sphingomonas yunnanensis]
MRLVPASTVGLVLVLSSPSLAQTQPLKAAEAALAALDMQQKGMVARADVGALDALSAPGLTINAPTGRVLTRAQFLAMMRDGRIGAEDFDRTIESVTVDGDLGVVMGREVFTPTPQSELGRTYGAVPLDRRYTNVYRREGGRWRWFARHANVVAKRAAEAR